MKAGKLRHRVTIEAPVNSANATGGRGATSWVSIPGGTVWADVRSMSAREIYQNGVMSMTASHMVTIRYLVGVHAGCRVSWGARAFLVNSVKTDDEMQRVNLDLTCEEMLVGATV